MPATDATNPQEVEKSLWEGVWVVKPRLVASRNVRTCLSVRFDAFIGARARHAGSRAEPRYRTIPIPFRHTRALVPARTSRRSGDEVLALHRYAQNSVTPLAEPILRTPLHEAQYRMSTAPITISYDHEDESYEREDKLRNTQ